MKVLVVDPDWRFASKVVSQLESHAHLVVHLTMKSHTLPQADRWQPDLVILAAEFAQDGLLEKLRDLPSPPAVLLTEYMDRYDRAWRAWQKGGHELLIKPMLTDGELHEAVVAALENAVSGERSVRPAAASA